MSSRPIDQLLFRPSIPIPVAMDLLIGLDVGTTGCKCSVFDEDGTPLCSAYREYPLICPKPAWAELDPKQVWQSITEAIGEALSRLEHPPEAVKSLAVSSQGEAFMPISREGEPLHNSIVTPDQRAQVQTEALRDLFGARWLFEETGMVLFPIYTLNKILWLRDNRPKVFEKTDRFLCWEDFVNFKLTGNAVIDHSLANRTLMFDIHNRRWSGEILDELDLDCDLLALPAPSGQEVGEVTPNAARETGLSPGTSVATGGHDQACGCLGAGVTDPGPVYDVTGTVECLIPSIHEPVLTEPIFEGGYGNYCHVVPERYLILGYNMTAGSILRWFRDEFAQEEVRRAGEEGRPVYDLLDEMAESIPPGSEGALMLPYFMGAATPNWDTNARGTLTGLTLAHGKGHIVRAIMEGITYELRRNIESLRSAGIGAQEIRTVGGGAASSFWCQLKADITGLPVHVPSIPEASSLGAALLAGIGSGTYGSHREAVKRTYEVSRVHTPSPCEGYEDGYANYKKLYDRLAPLFPELSG